MNSDKKHAIIQSVLYLIIFGCYLIMMGLDIITIATILLGTIIMLRDIYVFGVSDGIMRVKNKTCKTS